MPRPQQLNKAPFQSKKQVEEHFQSTNTYDRNPNLKKDTTRKPNEHARNLISKYSLS